MWHSFLRLRRKIILFSKHLLCAYFVGPSTKSGASLMEAEEEGEDLESEVGWEEGGVKRLEY